MTYIIPRLTLANVTIESWMGFICVISNDLVLNVHSYLKMRHYFSNKQFRTSEKTNYGFVRRILKDI